MALPKLKYPISELEIPTTKQKIKVRPFLVREEKLLLMARTTNLKADILAAVKQVVNNCILENDFDIDKLALVDLEYLFLKLRALSVNNICKVSYEDGQDNKIYDFTIDLNEIQIKTYEEANKVIPVFDKISVVMKYPNASLYADPEFSNENQEMEYFILKTIDKVMDGEQAFPINMENEDELKEFIQGLPLAAYEEIKKFWATIPHLYHEINYKNSLGNDRKIVLSSLEHFFQF